jgi:biopolymer transport protein ExbD
MTGNRKCAPKTDPRPPHDETSPCHPPSREQYDTHETIASLIHAAEKPFRRHPDAQPDVDDERQIELKLPQVQGQGAITAAPEKKVVNVYQDGEITLNHKSVTIEQLTAQLAAARSQYRALGVMVRGDGAASFQSVAKVLNACKQAGIADLAIAVEMASADKKHAHR